LNRIGFHKEIRSYDSAGNATSYSYFAKDGSPALGPRGAHTVTMEWGTDRLNRPMEFQKEIAIRVFGTDGLPTVFADGDSEGAHGVLKDYDNRGFVVRERYVDAGGLPVRGNMGSFGFSEERDDRGYVVRSAPLGPDMMPVDIPLLSYKLNRDEYGRETERMFLDASGAPVESNGVARIKKTYDPMGRVIVYETFGLDGQRAIDTDGSVITKYSYDPHGKLARREYMDGNNQLTLGDDGAAVIVFDRDRRGFVRAYQYFGVDEQPITGSGGWSVQQIVLDSFGNELEVRHFGIKGEPVLIKSGVHGWANTFDASGNKVEFAYRGLSWEPVAPVTGERISVYRYGYDARNRRISERFFDEGSVPVANKNGTFGRETTYNDRGDVVSSVHLGADGKPGADSTGESRSETVYDNRGFVIEQRYFDLSGSLLTTNRARSEHDRDRLGNEVESRFYSADGSFRKHSISGRAIVRRSFDDAGRQLSETSFGASGEPVNRLDEGWHQKTFSYSPGGARLGEACFKVSGEELPCP
jgi:hypothetical protein